MKLWSGVKGVILAGICLGSGACLGAWLYEKIQYLGRFEQYQKELFDTCRKENREHQVGLDGYFLRNGYKRPVVYGLGTYHKEFMQDITPSNFEKIYFADKCARTLRLEGERVYAMEELRNQDFYDVIVVTSLSHAEEIQRELRAAGIQKDIISYRSLVLNATKERQVTP